MGKADRRRPLHYDPVLGIAEIQRKNGTWLTVDLGGGGGGGGVTAHTALTALSWASSGHTGSATALAGFGGAGAATTYSLPLSVANGGTGGTSQATARAGLGLVIGTDVQAQDPQLQALAGLSPAADELAYWTGGSSAALTPLTAYARTLLDDTDAASALATLGAHGQIKRRMLALG